MASRNLLYAVLGIMGTIVLEAAKGQECRQRNCASMVGGAFAVNNKTLGDMVFRPRRYPTDDKWSADLQDLRKSRPLFSVIFDFMEVAFNSSDVQRDDFSQ